MILDMTELWRSKDGKTVHLEDCRHCIDGCIEWVWAAGRNSAEIAVALENGVRFCKVCHPLDAVDRDEADVDLATYEHLEQIFIRRVQRNIKELMWENPDVAAIYETDGGYYNGVRTVLRVVNNESQPRQTL